MEESLYKIFRTFFPPRKALPGILSSGRAAVFVPFFKKEQTVYVLFEKRAAGIKQGGEISFPGGKFDQKLDANTMETALRETIEELNIKPDQIVLDGMFDTIAFPEGGLIDVFYGFITISDYQSLQPNQAEVEKLIAIPFDYFLNSEPMKHRVRIDVLAKEIRNDEEVVLLPAEELKLPEKYHHRWGGVYRTVYVYPAQRGTVWGITAWIIREIVERYKEIKREENC